MTIKDYRLIAIAIRESRKISGLKVQDKTYEIAINRVIKELSMRLAVDNFKFEPSKFIEACK